MPLCSGCNIPLKFPLLLNVFKGRCHLERACASDMRCSKIRDIALDHILNNEKLEKLNKELLEDKDRKLEDKDLMIACYDAYNEWLPQDAVDELITEKLPDDVRLKDCHWMHTHNPHHISILGK